MDISEEQLRILESPDSPGFEERVVQHIRGTFGGRARLLDDEEILHAHRVMRPRAERHGFESGPEIGLFTDYAVILGSGFDRDPLLPWVGTILEDRSPGRRRRLYDGVMAHLDRQIRGHLVFPVLPIRRLRRAECVASDDFAPSSFSDADGRELCRALWSERAGSLDDAAWSAFAAASSEESVRLGLDTVAGRVLVMALCFVFGIEVARDPTLPMLARCFDDESRDETSQTRLARVRHVVRDTIDAVMPGAAGRIGSR